MDGIVLEARFSTSDLKKAGPTAVLAVDMILSNEEAFSLGAYKRWLQAEIEKQKEDYIKSKHLFENNNTLNEYESFKDYYFSALDKAETRQQLLDLYIERCKLVWAQLP